MKVKFTEEEIEEQLNNGYDSRMHKAPLVFRYIDPHGPMHSCRVAGRYGVTKETKIVEVFPAWSYETNMSRLRTSGANDRDKAELGSTALGLITHHFDYMFRYQKPSKAFRDLDLGEEYLKGLGGHLLKAAKQYFTDRPKLIPCIAKNLSVADWPDPLKPTNKYVWSRTEGWEKATKESLKALAKTKGRKELEKMLAQNHLPVDEIQEILEEHIKQRKKRKKR